MYLSKVCKNTTKGEPRSVVSLLVLGACFLSVSVRTIDSEPTAATAAVPETVSAPATVGSLFVVFFLLSIFQRSQYRFAILSRHSKNLLRFHAGSPHH